MLVRRAGSRSAIAARSVIWVRRGNACIALGGAGLHKEAVLLDG